jgi:hypothetical protein
VESRSAQLAVMAQDCDQPDYSKLVQALCSEANVSLITVPANKTLGEWCGLCKLDAEGLARKVVGCSFVVIKVRHRAPRSGFPRSACRARCPGAPARRTAALRAGFAALGPRTHPSAALRRRIPAPRLRSRKPSRTAGLRGGVRGSGRCPGVPEEQVERYH